MNDRQAETTNIAKKLGVRPDELLTFAFGDTEEMADRLAALVIAGKKTATASSAWVYEGTDGTDGADEPLPKVGDLSVVTRLGGDPLCVIETTSVEVRPFNEVDADFARAEGEGDLTLEWWREAHWDFWTRSLAPLGRAPTETMPVVMERFELRLTL